MTAPVILNVSKPDTVASLVRKQLAAVRLCRDLFMGGEAIRANAKQYLPQYPGELDANYQARKARLYPFLAFERTVTGLNGMIFRRDPVLGDDVPQDVAGDPEQDNAGGHWENIDLAGTHGDVFVRERAQDALVDGHAGIFVDFPNVGNQKPTLADEKAQNLRPYWVPVTKSQIINVRTAVVGGRVVLTLLVLEFCVSEPDGDFGEREVKQYRVYRNEGGAITWELWRKGPDDREPKPENRGTIANQTAIPFVPLYGPRKAGAFVSKPPLLDLAERQVAYLQVESDEITSLHMAGCPMPVLAGDMAAGDDADKLKQGPSWLTRITQGSTLTYLEHSGAALASFDKKLENMKGELATLGLAMLQRESRAAETAEGKRMDKSASDSALAVFARNIQDAIEQALMFHAKYLNEADGGSITINRDFESLTLDPATIQTYSNMVLSGQISLDTLWAMLVQGEVLPDGFDPDEEREKIASGVLPMPVMGTDEPKEGTPAAGDEEPEPVKDAA